MGNILFIHYRRRLTLSATKKHLTPARFSLRKAPLIGLASLMALSFVFSSGVAALLPNTASAATKPLEDQVLSFVTYNALYDCLDQEVQQSETSGFGSPTIRTSEANVKTGNWWRDSGNITYWGTTQGAESAGSYLNKATHANSGGTLCNDIVKTAVSIWNFKNPLDFLCSFVGYRANSSSCLTGTGDFGGFRDSRDNLKDLISKRVYGGNTPSLTTESKNTNAALYVVYREAFLGGCSPRASASPAKDFAYTNIRIITSTRADTTKTYEGVGRGEVRAVYRNGTGSTDSRNCGEISGYINQYASDYKTYLKGNPQDQGSTTQIAQACSGNSCSPTGTTTSCAVEGIGWILCPVANALAGITDALFTGVTAFMKVAPLGFNSDDPLYRAWSVMRSIANIAFVVVFLIIIFSQLTSMGVSNYGVKKLLPRLIVGAILVNLSYYICAVAVDASNILGLGIQAIFDEITKQTANTGVIGNNWGSITTSVLAGSGALVGTALVATAITSMSVWAMLAALLPLLVGALFALIIAFLVLLARQALIIMLIVLSPLAFVAYLLPNTEDLFKKWQKLFTSLLVLFPMLSIVFGGSMLASVILRESSNASLAAGTGNQFIAFCLYVGSFAVQAIPFFITPLLINLSQGVLGKFAGLVNNRNKGPIDRLRKGAERIGKDAQNRGFANKLRGPANIFNAGARRRARVERVSGSLENLVKHNASDYISEQLGRTDSVDANGKPISSLATRMAGGNVQAGQVVAAQAVAAGEAEELREAMQPLIRALSAMDPSKKQDHLKAEIAAGGARQSAALHYSAQIGDTSFLRDQLAAGEAHADPAKGAELMRKTREAIQANTSSVVGKAPDLVKGADAAFGSVKGNDLVQFKPDTAQAYLDHIEQLSRRTDTKGVEAYHVAVNGFNSSVEDITKSTELQGQFDGKVGSKIQSELATNAKYAAIAPSMYGTAAIQADGKIR